MQDGADRVVVDSSVWIARMRGQESAAVLHLDRLLDQRRVVLGDLVLAELLRGARDDQHAARMERALRRYEVLSMVGPDQAVQAARHYRLMRAAGITIRRTIDLLIGSFCIARGWPLLHQDRDFDAMERHCGLRVLRGPN